MLSMRKIAAGEIRAGDVVLLDVCDGRERTLLCGGFVVPDTMPIDAIVSEGVVVFAEGEVATRCPTPPLAVSVSPGAEHTAALQSGSAVQLLLYARQRLEEIVDAAPSGSFADEIRLLTEIVARACRISRDAALATALFERDGRYSIRHSLDVAVTCHVVGTAMKLEPVQIAAAVSAALTMNLSILRLQDELQAQKQELSSQQKAVIQSHPHAGVAMLKARGVTDEAWLGAVCAHHETYDGSGYPGKSEGDEIPLAAQLVALADVYCARVSARRYRRGLRPQDALRALLLDDGRNASQALAAQFIKAIGVFPAGTPVRLVNGEIAVVVGRGLKPTFPMVCSIIASNGMPLPSPIVRETLVDAYKIKELVDWREVGAIPRMRALWGSAAALS